MIYKFKSKAGGDVIMLQPHGDQLLRADRARAVGQGHHRSGRHAGVRSTALQKAAGAKRARRPMMRSGERGVGLKQRVWPMVEMLKRSLAAGEPIVWGV